MSSTNHTLPCSNNHICFKAGYELYRDSYGNLWKARISSPFYDNSFRLGKMVAKAYETDKIERIMADEQQHSKKHQEQGQDNKGVRHATVPDQWGQMEFAF